MELNLRPLEDSVTGIAHVMTPKQPAPAVMRALALLCAAAETERHLHWRVVHRTPDVRIAHNMSRHGQVFALLGSRDSILCGGRSQAVTTRVRGQTHYRG